MDAIGSRQEVLSSSFMVEDSIEESAHDPQSVNTDQLPPQKLESQARRMIANALSRSSSGLRQLLGQPRRFEIRPVAPSDR